MCKRSFEVKSIHRIQSIEHPQVDQALQATHSGRWRLFKMLRHRKGNRCLLELVELGPGRSRVKEYGVVMWRWHTGAFSMQLTPCESYALAVELFRGSL